MAAIQIRGEGNSDGTVRSSVRVPIACRVPSSLIESSPLLNDPLR
jgi:hypothetical protein